MRGRCDLRITLGTPRYVITYGFCDMLFEVISYAIPKSSFFTTLTGCTGQTVGQRNQYLILKMTPRIWKIRFWGKKRKKKFWGVSPTVTHPSTNPAHCCLTSIISRDLLFHLCYPFFIWEVAYFADQVIQKPRT